jgi:hypothetical protein
MAVSICRRARWSQFLFVLRINLTPFLSNSLAAVSDRTEAQRSSAALSLTHHMSLRARRTVDPPEPRNNTSTHWERNKIKLRSAGLSHLSLSVGLSERGRADAFRVTRLCGDDVFTPR